MRLDRRTNQSFATRTLGLITCGVVLLGGWAGTRGAALAAEPAPAGDVCPLSTPPVDYEPEPVEQEQDRIFMLLAYAVVYKDWQTESWPPRGSDGPRARGYNIGSVLVNAETKRPVCWARNNVIRLLNGTQHGEVRLITNYLHNNRHTTKVGGHSGSYKLYTSLEPCVMCSGMMTMQQLAVTIYGQTDPSFGKALERLEVNTKTALPHGYCPYPWPVRSILSDVDYAKRLDETYDQLRAHHVNLTTFLKMEEARQIYAAATAELESYQLRFPEENAEVLLAAQRYLEAVPDHFVNLPYSEACPGGS